MRLGHSPLRPILARVLGFALSAIRVPPSSAQSVSTFASSITHARGLAMDVVGQLYVGMLNRVIYKGGPGGSPGSTFNSSMASCVGFARGPAGNWYATSYDNVEIFRITPAGGGSRRWAAGTRRDSS